MVATAPDGEPAGLFLERSRSPLGGRGGSVVPPRLLLPPLPRQPTIEADQWMAPGHVGAASRRFFPAGARRCLQGLLLGVRLVETSLQPARLSAPLLGLAALGGELLG